MAQRAEPALLLQGTWLRFPAPTSTLTEIEMICSVSRKDTNISKKFSQTKLQSRQAW